MGREAAPAGLPRGSLGRQDVILILDDAGNHHGMANGRKSLPEGS